MEPELENLQFSGVCSRVGQALSNGVRRCIQASDSGINRMDRFGNALGNLGTGIGKFGTGVAIAGATYHELYGKKENDFKPDPSSSPYHLIWKIEFINFIQSFI